MIRGGKATTESAEVRLQTWKKLVSEENGVTVWFAVRGRSMYPLLRAQRDRVPVKPMRPEEMQIGDIVLFPIRGQKADCAVSSATEAHRKTGGRPQKGGFLPFSIHEPYFISDGRPRVPFPKDSVRTARL